MPKQLIEAEQVYLKRKHCYIKYLCAKQRPNHFLSNPEYGCKFFGSLQGTEEERIAYFISGVPDIKLITKIQPLTYNTLQTWLGYRDECIGIAQCFLSIRGSTDDSLLESLNKGEIDQWKYKYKWLEAELYKNLWHLIHQENEILLPVLQQIKGYTFASDVDLFCEIFREVIEGEFIPYLASFYQYNANHIKEIHKLKRRMHKNNLSESEEKKFWGLRDKYAAPSIWCDHVLAIANALAEKGVLSIKTYLDVHSEVIDAMARLKIQSACDPKLKHHWRKSHYCDEGIITEGIMRKW